MSPTPPDPTAESDARAYWRGQMEAAWRLMDECLRQPVQECGEPLADLRSAAESAGVPLRFSTTPVLPGTPRLFYLRAGLVAPLLAAARACARRGWLLKIEDGYRTRAIQTGLGREPRLFDAVYELCCWETGGREPDADLMGRRLAVLIATRPKIGTHMSGSALDLSVLDAASGREVDRGGTYVDFSLRTPMASPYVSAEARRNRAAITALLAESGFVAYPFEYWHYSQGDVFAACLNPGAGPVRYGAVDADLAGSLAVRPIPRPGDPLQPPEQIAASLAAARARRRSGEPRKP